MEEAGGRKSLWGGEGSSSSPSLDMLSVWLLLEPHLPDEGMWP